MPQGPVGRRQTKVGYVIIQEQGFCRTRWAAKIWKVMSGGVAKGKVVSGLGPRCSVSRH